MLDINSLRSAFDSADKKEGGSNRPNNYYPFWNIKDEEQAVIRFLPDKNGANPFGFIVEKLTHALIINGEKRNVPCRRMFNEDCPVCKVSSSFYKEEGKQSVNGKKYWRKKGHIAQALIIEDPLAPNEETGENHQGQVRFISLGYQLYNVIKEALKSGELDNVPFSFEEGYNFIIKKTKQGEYSTYTIGSRFKSKPSALSAEDIEVLQEQLVDLTTLLPKDLGEAKVSAMLEAALTGADYSDESSEDSAAADADDEAVVTSSVAKKPTTTSVVKKPIAAAQVVDADEEETAEVVTKVTVAKPTSVVKPAPSAVADSDGSEGDDEAEKILAQIHARRQAKAAGK